MTPKNVGICVFDGVELLDFATPFEVFYAPKALGKPLFNVFTLSADGAAVTAFGGLSIGAMYDREQHPPLDVLVIPGGEGTKAIARDAQWLQWIRNVHLSTELTLVICSAARIAAQLQWLNGQPFCTHASVANEVMQFAKGAAFRSDVRCIQTGKLITTSGVTAALDGSLMAMELLADKKTYAEVKRYLEVH